MKLLVFISEDFYFLSHRVDLLTGLRDLGWEVTLVTNLQEREVEVKAVGIPVYQVDLNRKSLSPFSVFKGALSYRRVIKRVKPDILFAVALKPIITIAIARFLGMRQPVLSAFTGLGSAFVENSTSKSLRAARWGMEQLFRSLFNNNHYECLFQNHDDAKFFREKNWTIQERCHVVHGSGVVLQDFPEKLWPSKERLEFLFAGRLLWDKGVGELVSACHILRDRGLPFVCRIAGLIDSTNKSSVPNSFMEEQHRAGVIEWLGPRRDIIQMMSKSDCFVFPSLYREGVPRVLLEASAAGLPMITTDSPGCRDVVESGYNGLLVRPGDSEHLASAMEVCIRDRHQLETWGANARKRAEANHGVENVVKRHNQILQGMVQKHNLGR